MFYAPPPGSPSPARDAPFPAPGARMSRPNEQSRLLYAHPSRRDGDSPLNGPEEENDAPTNGSDPLPYTSASTSHSAQPRFRNPFISSPASSSSPPPNVPPPPRNFSVPMPPPPRSDSSSSSPDNSFSSHTGPLPTSRNSDIQGTTLQQTRQTFTAMASTRSLFGESRGKRGRTVNLSPSSSDDNVLKPGPPPPPKKSKPVYKPFKQRQLPGDGTIEVTDSEADGSADRKTEGGSGGDEGAVAEGCEKGDESGPMRDSTLQENEVAETGAEVDAGTESAAETEAWIQSIVQEGAMDVDESADVDPQTVSPTSPKAERLCSMF